MENVLALHSHCPLYAHTSTASITLERSIHQWGARTEIKDLNLTRCAGLDSLLKFTASAGTAASSYRIHLHRCRGSNGRCLCADVRSSPARVPRDGEQFR